MRIPRATDDFLGNQPKVSDDAHRNMDPDQNIEYLGEVLVWTTPILLYRFRGSFTDIYLQFHRFLTS